MKKSTLSVNKLFSFLLGLLLLTSYHAQTLQTEVITSGTTWTVPANVSSINVTCIGGGGAGGGAGSAGRQSGGGGGGALAQTNNIAVTDGQLFNISVGAGGLGANNVAGPPGGDTWFSSATTIMAKGGAGGARHGNGGQGGQAAASFGSLTRNGGNGGNPGNGSADCGGCGAGGGGGAAGTTNVGNNGGNGSTSGNTGGPGGVFRNNYGGAGGQGTNNGGNGTSASNAANNFGGGGGGGKQASFFGSQQRGGNGQQGAIIITYFFNYHATYTAMSTGSTTWCPGETRNVSVTITNSGSLPWTDVGLEDFNIGVKWNVDSDYLVRVDAQNLAPGASQTYTLAVTAPATLGAENLTFNVVREGVAWFGGTYVSPAQTIVAGPTVNAGADFSICGGVATSLNGSVTNPLLSGVAAAQSGTIVGDNGNPLRTAWGNSRTQNLYTAAELSAAGLTTGAVINSISLDVTSAGQNRTTLVIGYKFVPAGTTTLTTTFQTGFTTVFNGALNAAVGVKTYTFSSPSTAWNGTDNIVFDYCFTQNVVGATSCTIRALAAAPSARSTQVNADNNNPRCAIATGATSTRRPYIIFGYTSAVNSTWSPGTSLSSTTILNPTTTTTSDITYTLSATANGCTSTDDVNVTITAGPTDGTLAANLTTVCSGQSVTVTPSGGTGTPFYWISSDGGVSWNVVAQAAANGPGNSYIFTPPPTGGTFLIHARWETTCGFCWNIPGHDWTTNNLCPSFAAVTVTANPSNGTALGLNGESATCTVTENNWVHFYHSSGRLLASINSGGQNLGNVTVTSYVDGANAIVPACDMPSVETAVLQRHWVIEPQFQPASNVLVRLPFGSAEVASLATAAGTTSNTADNSTGIPNIQLSRYHGPANMNASALDNCTADGGDENTVIHSPSANGATNAYSNVIGEHYNEYSIPEFSEFWLHWQADASPLPIVMNSVNVECSPTSNEVTLEWTTTSELNSDKYLVQRSRDGNVWETIGEEQGAGNSSSITEYTFTDASSLGGQSYYRIIQSDFDGTATVYGPWATECFEKNGITVYPNPTAGKFVISISSEEDQKDAILEIMDLSGKIISSEEVQIESGATEIYRDFSDLNAGTYLVVVRTTKGVFSPVRVVKGQ
jgi:hypothetical protein